MEMVLNLGVFLTPNSKVSITRRIEGSGGQMYSLCAMYSLRVSFCSVPDIGFPSAPLFSGAARYIDRRSAGGELMVVGVVTWARGILSKSTSMSASELMATPHLPTSPSEST